MPLSSYSKLLSLQVSFYFHFDYKVSELRASILRSLSDSEWDATWSTDFLLSWIRLLQVHAGFAGFTGVTVGIANNHYVLLPIPEVIAYARNVDPNSRMWHRCLTSTGQPDFLWERRLWIPTLFVSWIATIVGACTVALFMANLLRFNKSLLRYYYCLWWWLCESVVVEFLLRFSFPREVQKCCIVWL